MTDVFVSYKRDDELRVGKLVEGLRQCGLTVWWDKDISPGTPWESAIEGELARARLVIVVWSRSSVESENVKAEARRARHERRLVQVYIERCEPPLFFGESQGIDLATWDGDKANDTFRKVLSAVLNPGAAAVVQDIASAVHTATSLWSELRYSTDPNDLLRFAETFVGTVEGLQARRRAARITDGRAEIESAKNIPRVLSKLANENWENARAKEKVAYERYSKTDWKTDEVERVAAKREYDHARAWEGEKIVN